MMDLDSDLIYFGNILKMSPFPSPTTNPTELPAHGNKKMGSEKGLRISFT